jgi:predicted secreted protein
MAINGTNILIYLNGSPIAGSRSDDVQTDGDLIETASPTSGDWKTYLAGRKNWSLNISWLVTDISDINNLLLVNTTVTVRILGRGASLGLTGTAIVQKCKMSATRGSIANGALTLQGSGPLQAETAAEQ